MVLACSAIRPLNVLPNGGSSRSPIALLKGEKAEFESKLFLAEKAYQGATDCAAYGTDNERGFSTGNAIASVTFGDSIIPRGKVSELCRMIEERVVVKEDIDRKET